MAATTTICIDPKAKDKLDELKIFKNESYNSVVERLIKMAYDEEPLTDEEIEGIKESIEDIKANRVFTEGEAKKMLGIED
jgi:predicted transcriptional regulator